jgi:CRP-like cAMP-binding protein
MEKFRSVLSTVALFDGMTWEEITALLSCLGGVRRSYGEGNVICLEGETARHIGVVLEGAVQVVDEDVFGRRSIVGVMEAGELFGEAFACAEVVKAPLSTWSKTNSEILFLEYRRVIHTCSDACSFHSRLVVNMVSVLAKKNVLLNQKIRYLSRRSTRGKLLAYLSECAKNAGDPVFQIPFDRQALADYLCVERSAMSAELSKLRQEGVLDFHRSTFRFLRAPEDE